MTVLDRPVLDGPPAGMGDADRELLERANAILEQSTWDSIAERMWALMEERLADKQ